ncbi:hypothetical protein OUZ56_002586 [Daphnia magna]|uniref:Uncharacterized protein n=1 Tax=Daphnia magna TaxID=35525 RepID=A0ABR0A661_9CRUS|nr:hypothetical protein OUZ56_002586 [Daphnia magna]
MMKKKPQKENTQIIDFPTSDVNIISGLNWFSTPKTDAKAKRLGNQVGLMRKERKNQREYLYLLEDKSIFGHGNEVESYSFFLSVQFTLDKVVQLKARGTRSPGPKERE